MIYISIVVINQDIAKLSLGKGSVQPDDVRNGFSSDDLRREPDTKC